MALFLDILVFLIVVLTMYKVIKKGFVRTVIDFISVIGSLIIAKIFAEPVSSFFYKGLNKVASEKINEIIEGMIKENNLPNNLEADELFKFLNKYNVDLVDMISSDAIENSVNIIAQYLVGILAYAVAFLVLFILSVVSFKILSLVLGGVFELPILKTVNKSLALVLAVVVAIVYVLLFIAIMQMIIPYFSSVYPEFINAEIIEKSFVFDYLYNFEWIKIFVN